MFEIEAEEYAENREVCDLLDAISEDLQNYDYGTVAHYNIDPLVEDCFKDGAEFGYNKAKKDADEMKSRFLELCNLKDMRIKELEKANEWHYVKDELPEKEKYVLVYTKLVNVYMARLVKNNYFINKNGGFVQTSSVIAWKEIILPELKESE